MLEQNSVKEMASVVLEEVGMRMNIGLVTIEIIFVDLEASVAMACVLAKRWSVSSDFSILAGMRALEASVEGNTRFLF